MPRLLLLAVLMLAPLAAAAQAPAYDRAPGDTLRYTEATHNVLEVEVPAGTTSQIMRHEATLAITFEAGDAARAWYEDLRVEHSQAGRMVEVPVEAVLGQPFTLRFPATGRIETVGTPRFPVDVIAVTDLRLQFFDFFITLPEEPLAPGVTWTDTAELERVDEGEVYRSRIESVFEVVEETEVSGRQAFVISVEARHLVGFEAEVEGGAIMRVSMEGTETGRVVLGDGRLLVRQRTARLAGDLVVDQQDGEIRLPQRYRYESEIRVTSDE